MSPTSTQIDSNALASWVSGAGQVLSSALLVGFMTFVLIHVVRRFLPSRLCDPSPLADERERQRKLQGSPVPLVGGLALWFGLIISGSLAARTGFDLLGWPWPGAFSVSTALLLAFGVGFVDDWLPRGLSPGRKFFGQCLAGLPLGYGMWAELAGSFETNTFALLGFLAASACLAAIAQNAINTFDNANGVATGISALAMAMCSPAAAGALLGFLPFNLCAIANSEARQASTPKAYLGDSGSHLLGMWLLLTPLAWPVLALPLIDLARLFFERIRSGKSPFRGDRRHLAHLLAERGLGEYSVVSVLAGIAAPSIVLGTIALRTGRTDLLLIGVGATLCAYVAFFVAIRNLGQASPEGKDRSADTQHRVAQQSAAYIPVEFKRTEQIDK